MQLLCRINKWIYIFTTTSHVKEIETCIKIIHWNIFYKFGIYETESNTLHILESILTRFKNALLIECKCSELIITICTNLKFEIIILT